MCGFIIVSAFEAYNKFYQELEEDLAQWTINQYNVDLSNLIAVASSSAKSAASDIVTEQGITTKPSEATPIASSSSQAEPDAKPVEEETTPAPVKEETTTAPVEPTATLAEPTEKEPE